MSNLNLTILILKKICHRTLKRTNRACRKSRRMLACLNAQSSCLNSNHFYCRIVNKRIEESYRITAAAYTGHKIFRQSPFSRDYLLPCLCPYYRLEIPDHHRIRMGAKHRAEDIMGCTHIGSPVPHGLTYCVFQCLAPVINRRHLCTEEPHPEDIKRLPLHIFCPHVYLALKAKHCSDRCSCNAMLAGSCLSYYTAFSHAPCQ